MATKSMSINKDKSTIMLVTFGFVMAEAILHYNIGVKSQDPNHKLSMPSTKDLIKLAGTVAIFSIASSMVANHLIQN